MHDFDERFRALFRRAYGVAFVVLGDRAEAEDVAQEVLTRALQRWSKVVLYADAWVVRVAGNLAIDRSRHRRRRVVLANTTSLAMAEPDADRVDLQRALRSLPRRQREVVVMRYFGELAVDEVAAALGCTPGTVKTHAHRGLEALRDVLAVQ